MSSLRSLVLTPQRVPSFVVPSRSPLLLLPPQAPGGLEDQVRLLSDLEEDAVGRSPPDAPPSPVPSPRLLLRLPRLRSPQRSAAEDADTDVTTRAAMSLPHVGKVTTPYGFHAVLVASPCTRRRESLFHRSKAEVETDGEPRDRRGPPPPSSGPHGFPVCTPPIKALALQVMKELKRPAAVLKALSPTSKRTRPL
ncbi:C2 calcium-dependent domain-containing protein 4C-like [Plectropomus leopardus]|uniref:C2 calcium-dependent domain-containing protein 4C-like n=1 Tax=Plectropomus leopardus TaxID=160734 RepID=UPI001C4AAF84|nr:C2 calcium-dependent domain-containing protein 4C-like [Plectropomus leopardus]